MSENTLKSPVDAAEIVADAVRRLVEGFHPVRVILFGSRASGPASADSDFDLLVVMPGDSVAARIPGAMRLALRGIPASFDILPVAEKPWKKWSVMPLTMESRIANEGKVVFDERG